MCVYLLFCPDVLMSKSQEVVDVCYSDQVLDIALNSGEEFTVDYWHTSATTSPNFRCHLWCNSNGSFPMPLLPRNNLIGDMVCTKFFPSYI